MYYKRISLICTTIILLLFSLLFSSCFIKERPHTDIARLTPFTTSQFEKVVEGFVALAPGNYFRDSIFINVNIDKEDNYYSVSLYFEMSPSSLSSIQLDRYRGCIRMNDTVFLLLFTDTANPPIYSMLFRDQFIDTNISFLNQMGTLLCNYDPYVFDFHMYDDTVLVFDGLSIK